MSRSRRKTPICGTTTAPSDRPHKKIYWGQERTRERVAMARLNPDRGHVLAQSWCCFDCFAPELSNDEAILSHALKKYDQWDAPKDGKWYDADRHSRTMRK